MACPHGLRWKDCSPCAVERVRQWRINNPGRREKYKPEHGQRFLRWVRRNKERAFVIQKRHKLNKRFGITIKDYEDMLIKQEGKCAICGELPVKRRHAVDHDHNTGKVRGLLCWRCNRTIGALNDDPVLIRKAAEYLEQHSAPTP